MLADCKGLSVCADLYWAKGKQQDSTWGPIKGHSSWKSALAHGLECTGLLIFCAVGAQSIFTGCSTPAGAASMLILLLTLLGGRWSEHTITHQMSGSVENHLKESVKQQNINKKSQCYNYFTVGIVFRLRLFLNSSIKLGLRTETFADTWLDRLYLLWGHWWKNAVAK